LEKRTNSNRLKLFRAALGAGAAVVVALLLSRIYVSLPKAWFAGGLVLGVALYSSSELPPISVRINRLGASCGPPGR